ncbi:MAG TPA: hypothetical protein PK400_02635 [Phycisphaerales bacterium]|nr:hypothetical protein [Phycisphaerales bacterium]HRQ75902.1 hypothetical protein [Phycisphaerales bacterium]
MLIKNAKLILIASMIAAGLVSCSQQRERLDVQEPHPREWPPPLMDMNDVMHAKLVHTQAIVEGLAIGDLRQVRLNAEQLQLVSMESTWMVHDTVAYVALSDDFRAIARALAEHAAANDLNAATTSYAALTNSCIACHTYLRQERLLRDAPGRLSWRP